MTCYLSYILSYLMLGLLLVPGCYGNYVKNEPQLPFIGQNEYYAICINHRDQSAY